MITSTTSVCVSINISYLKSFEDKFQLIKKNAVYFFNLYIKNSELIFQFLYNQ